MKNQFFKLIALLVCFQMAFGSFVPHSLAMQAYDEHDQSKNVATKQVAEVNPTAVKATKLIPTSLHSMMGELPIRKTTLEKVAEEMTDTDAKETEPEETTDDEAEDTEDKNEPDEEIVTSGAVVLVPVISFEPEDAKEDPSFPSDPEEPGTEPNDPVDPVDPSDPTDPSEPADPSEPNDPTGPSDPTVDPSDPSEPGEPDDGSDDAEDPPIEPPIPPVDADNPPKPPRAPTIDWDKILDSNRSLIRKLGELIDDIEEIEDKWDSVQDMEAALTALINAMLAATPPGPGEPNGIPIDVINNFIGKRQGLTQSMGKAVSILQGLKQELRKLENEAIARHQKIKWYKKNRPRDRKAAGIFRTEIREANKQYAKIRLKAKPQIQRFKRDYNRYKKATRRFLKRVGRVLKAFNDKGLINDPSRQAVVVAWRNAVRTYNGMPS